MEYESQPSDFLFLTGSFFSVRSMPVFVLFFVKKMGEKKNCAKNVGFGGSEGLLSGRVGASATNTADRYY